MRETTSVDDFVHAGARGRRTTHPLLVIVLCQVFYTAVLLGVPLSGVVERVEGAAGTGAAVALGLLVQTAQILLPYVPLVLWLRHFEGRAPFASTGLRFDRRAFSGLGAGFGVAAVFVAAWVLVGLAFGAVRFDGVRAAGPGEVAGVALVGVFLVLQRIAMIGVEEQLYRGWLLQAAGSRWGTAAGVLVSSFFFALMHFFFVGSLLTSTGRTHEPHWVLALNIFLWAVFAALWTLRVRSLWPAVGFHAAALVLPLFLPTVATEETAERYPSVVLFVIEDPNHYTGGVGFAGLFEGLPATAALAVLVAAAGAALHRGSRGRRAARDEGLTGRPPG